LKGRAVVVVGSRAHITRRDLELLTFAGEMFGVPMGLAAELLCRHAAGTLSPRAAETVARRTAARLEAGGYARRLTVAGQVWLVPTGRGLALVCDEDEQPYEVWQPQGWKLEHVATVARLRLWLLDRYPGASWESERAIRRRWAAVHRQVGIDTRTRYADGGLHLADGRAVGVEVELHVKKPALYEGIVADQDPDWHEGGVWWFTPPAHVDLLRARLADARGGRSRRVPTARGGEPVNRQPPPHEPHPGVALFVLAFFLSPFVLLAWAAGIGLLRWRGWRGWRIALPALAWGGLWVLAEGGPGPALAHHFSGYLGLLAQFGQPMLHLPPLGSFLWPQIPLAVPTGLLAASLNGPGRNIVTPEFEQAEQRRRQRQEQRTRRKAEQLAGKEATRPESDALGTSLGGNLDSWRRGRLVVPPAGQLGLATLLIGAPGAGKTVCIERLSYLAAHERRREVVVDAKGGHDGLAQGVVAAYLAARPDARVRLFPQEPLDIWRGSPAAIVNRLVNVWDWTPESAYYREIATVALRLAIGQPGPPCRSTSELVARLDGAALAQAWAGHRAETSLVRGLKDKLADVQLRVANLVAALGPAFDGSWSWEDCDLAVVTVPSMVASLDANACLRVLLSDIGHFTMERKPPGAPAQVMVDEFSAIQGGRPIVIDLLERGRGAGTGVVLAAQSSAALGDEDERARLLAAASAVIAFRSPQPAELAALAGSERVAEAAFAVEDGELTGRQTVTMRARARVDQDELRSAPTGVATIIAAGRKERARIIRTAIGEDVRTRAVELVAGEQPALPDREQPKELDS
jgi:hypothetical protein